MEKKIRIVKEQDTKVRRNDPLMIFMLKFINLYNS